ncbi:hypothetical protein OCF15_17490 [Bacillus cereus]|nr:hypothetical protein [Bacillus cereus]
MPLKNIYFSKRCLNGDNPQTVKAFKTYNDTEKNIVSAQKFAGEVIPTSTETITFDPSKGKYELSDKPGEEVEKDSSYFNTMTRLLN